VFSLPNAGIWAETIRTRKPLIVNDYTQSDSRKKGYPVGHVRIRRLLSIPIIKGDKAVAVMAVANKELEYTQMDILHLSLFIESMWDILKRKEAEEKLHKLNETLEQTVAERTKQLIRTREELVRKEKFSVLGQLAGVVGHELRNPLGVMNNAVYFLRTVMTDADDTVREYLDIIKQEIDNSQQIIADLLGFARTKTPQPRSVTVRELTEGSLGKCHVSDDIDVQTNIPETLPYITIDPFQIGQVFQNLITNAVQAMPEGGVLTVAARQIADPESPVRTRQSQVSESEEDLALHTHFVEISITDTGVGIPPENMGKLFQPLFTTKTKGIGLGLVVCKNLVEANGGRIEVKSELGKGATFTVVLPL
jgi:signal transduction histidine kinase